MPSDEFQRFEAAANPTIWLPAQSAANRISLQCASMGQKITLKRPAIWGMSVKSAVERKKRGIEVH
jgi:hypothetical protein